MVRIGESSETMMPVMIETREDISSGVNNLDIGLTQMSAQRVRVSNAVMM